jgi:hypothetical protein
MSNQLIPNFTSEYSSEKYELKKRDNKTYLHMDVIYDNKDNYQELIVEKLKEYYDFLKELVETKQ